MNRRLYALHRWVSALTFLQLFVWTATGTFFAVVPIGKVRGAAVPKAHERPLPKEGAWVAPSRILGAVTSGASQSLELKATPTGTYYFLKTQDGPRRFDALTGSEAPVTQAEAEATAQRDQPGRPEVSRSTRFETPPGIEYRGGALPVWQVHLNDGKGTAVYVDARTGEVTARRTTLWRWYDGLWALHIMDYSGRDDFNHPLLIGFAGVSVTTVLTGLVLWVLRGRRWLQQQRRSRAA